MSYRLAMFDFDGTLADSFPFFLSVFNTLADRHGFRPIDTARADELRHYGVREMMQHVGLPAWKLPIVSRAFIALMKDSCEHVQVFEGVAQSLARLDEAGVQLALVSSNSEHNARKVLGPQLAARFIRFECGMSILGKAARLKHVMKQLGCTGAQAIYVGDHGADAEAARKAGTAFGAVSWGYCPIASLRAHGVQMEFANPAELVRIAGG